MKLQETLELLFPKAEATDEGVFVFAEADAVGQCVEFFAVAATEDDVIGGERFLEKFHDFGDVAAPLFLAKTFEAAKAEIVFVGFPFFVEKMREFNGLEKSVVEHGGDKAGDGNEE